LVRRDSPFVMRLGILDRPTIFSKPPFLEVLFLYRNLVGQAEANRWRK
jgi:hypothetical protein